MWTNLAEDYTSAREILAGLLLQRTVGADVAGTADSVGNAVVDLGAEDISVESDDELMAEDQFSFFLSRGVASALLRGQEGWPQGYVAARGDQAFERRSAPLVRSESRRLSHPQHALFGPSTSQCRHSQAERQSSRELIFGALPHLTSSANTRMEVSTGSALKLLPN